MGNDYLVTIEFEMQEEKYEVETAFVTREVEEFMEEFQCNEDHALRGLSRVYLLEHYGRDAFLKDIAYRKGYRRGR